MMTVSLMFALLSTVQEPTLAEVLTRVEHYVIGYEAQLSKYVATEQYLQKLHIRGRPGDSVRQLVSDFLFARLPGDQGPWLGIRQVLSVDGRSVPNTEDRLRAVIGATHQDAAQAAATLAHDNARFNLGSYLRTVNVPVGVLGWLEPPVRSRFDFARTGKERLDGVTVWRIEFTERDAPTVIRTHDGGDVLSRGRVWVEPATGRVFQTELENSPGDFNVTIRVRFRMNQSLGFMTPITMHEYYNDGAGALAAEARYSNFRVFGVTTRIK